MQLYVKSALHVKLPFHDNFAKKFNFHGKKNAYNFTSV